MTLTNLNESVTGTVTVSGTPVVGQTLTASNTLADPDGLGTITYQWYRDGQPILYGGTLKDDVNGVDGLDYARTITLSADGGHAYVAAAEDNSVSWFDRDMSTGALTYRGMLKDGLGGVDGLNKAYVVTLSSDDKNAFVTSNFQNSLSWFERNETTGALVYGGTLKDGVGGVDGLRTAINSSLSSDGKHIYVVGREDHSVSWFERDASTGALSYRGMLKDGLGGVDGLWQAHWVTLSANGLHAYVVAERDYSLSWFDRNQTTGALTYRGTLWDGLNGVDGLFSPRSVKFSPSEKHLYVAAAGDNSVSWFERNASTGALSFGGMLKDGLNGVDGLDGAFQLTASPDGRFMYVVAVFDNSVSWYERNASTGALTYGGMLKDGLNGVDGLDGAESITTSPDGSYVYIAACNDDSVSWFTRDPVTGALTYGSASDGNYTLTAADLGKTITVMARYMDGGGFEHNFSSAGTPLVYPAYYPSRPNHFVDLNSSVNLEMIWVEPGTFIMGDSDISNASPEHNVTLTKGFYLGKYEVTQAQYEAVMVGNDKNLSPTPSQWPNNPNRPVEKVSWQDIQVFITRLNDQQAGSLPDGWVYDLPTEAQWEYACRAGTTTAYSWGNWISATDANWNHGADANQTEDVGLYYASPWGFFDMHGNVWEWVADAYLSYSSGARTDPFDAGATDSNRIRRGGSWYNGVGLMPLARRVYNSPSYRTDHIGFRLAYRQITTPPGNLVSTAPLTIAENPPIGTVVGEFNATDPDAGATLTYYLVSGAGDTHNTLFTLETNGTLKTATTFDFETNASTYAIRVEARDEYNATVEGNFTVTLTDVYEPSQPPHSIPSASNLEMIWVEPGTFKMGSPTSEANRTPNETERNVTLTKGFYLGKYEVTQAQYQAVMTGNSNGLSATPSQYNGNLNRPVEKVSWNDIQVFLSRLNAAEQSAGRLPAGWSYILPTEAQWEYACRAGTATAYSWGNSISALNANYNQSGIGKSRPVGKYSANPWGFYDMHGNVSEWTHDWGSAFSGAHVSDPSGPNSGSYKIRRGGGFNYPASSLRSAKRMWGTTYGRNNRHHNLGFRVGFQNTNNPPTNPIATSPLTIAENQPIGTVVGEFNATDPDAGASLTYHLVSGAGDTHNTFFTLETNGTLKTATIFDYEINASTYSIRVQAKDEFNATVEGNFTVMLTDVYEPSQPNHFVDLNATVNLEMIWVEPGTFTMGSPTSETGRGNFEGEHNVSLTKGFYLGKYEVTQEQWFAIMGTSISHFSGNKLPGREGELARYSSIVNTTQSEQDAGACLQVGHMPSQRNPNGNMPVGRVRQPSLPTATVCLLPMRISMERNLTVERVREQILDRLATSALTRPTHGVSSICTETYGNGAPTGLSTIRVVRFPIPWDLQLERKESTGVDHGAMQEADCVLHGEIELIQILALMTWASVSLTGKSPLPLAT